MNFRRNFERIYLITQAVVDGIAVMAACLAGYQAIQLFYQSQLRWPSEEYRVLFIWILLVSIVSFAANGMYSTQKSLLNVVEFERLGRSTGIAFLVVSALVFLLRESPVTSQYPYLAQLQNLISLDTKDLGKGTVVFSFFFIFLVVATERFVFFKIIQEAHRRGIGHHHVFIIGAGATGQKVREKLIVSPTIGFNLRGFIDDDEKLTGTRVDGVPVVGTFANLEQLISENKIHTVFVAIPEDDENKILEVVRRCRAVGIEVCIVPRLWHVLSYPVRLERLDSIPLIVPRKNADRLTTAVFKRMIDIAGASIALLLLSPIFILVPIFVKLESAGPAFFRQKRAGRNGRLFEMLKFRTMHSSLSGDALKPQSSDDPRITKIGKWLRRTSIDEIPQFWNVLRGDMSLVGPRPEMQFIVEAYSEADRARLSVKPGITGLWQISYARLRPIHKNLDYDLYYVEHQSLLLDLVILFLTPFALLKGTGAH
ncbi:MAG: sugar transferase [Planctomycetota bacterium]